MDSRLRYEDEDARRAATTLASCDCRANDWVEGDCGAIRCAQCGGYTGEPGTSIRVVEAS